MARTSGQYPWGTDGPRAHLNRVSRRLRKTLETARQPGFDQAPARASAAVLAVHPLIDAFRYLCDEGWHNQSPQSEPLSPDVVLEQIQQVYDSINAFATVSNITWSTSYAKFEQSVDELFNLVDQAIESGIAPRDPSRGSSVWSPFRKRLASGP